MQENSDFPFQDELRDKENRLKLAADVLSSDYVPDRYGSFKPTRNVPQQSEETSVASEYHSATFMRSQTPRAPRVSKLKSLTHIWFTISISYRVLLRQTFAIVDPVQLVTDG